MSLTKNPINLNHPYLTKVLDPFDLPTFGRPKLWISLIDSSLSMDEKDYPPSRLGAAANANWQFMMSRRKSAPGDWVAIITFEASAKIQSLPVPLADTKAIAALHTCLGKLRVGGGTNMQAGLDLVECITSNLREELRGSHIPGPDLRLIVLTDGHSNGNPQGASNRLKQTGTVIEIIGIGGSPKDVNESLLKQCASVENGRLLYRFIGAGNTEELNNHFTGISRR